MEVDPTTRQIIELAAWGLTVSQIADWLNLPPDTVRARLRAAMRETGARTKLELVIKALKAGLIEL